MIYLALNFPWAPVKNINIVMESNKNILGNKKVFE